ncbi:MAG: hypothetical protein B7Z66_12260 [Chromatiales bacterium 21-64-14]|nr:MAG: hypothetical protein B7Z66_12260 [Chromatiales bacterium 21-64-14]HQU15492.1 FlhC family transcriptional regulator [Gammaproteobacteria bacterium]
MLTSSPEPSFPDMLRRMDLAISLIRQGVRPPITARLTALPGSALRKIWEQIHNKSAPRGQFPPDATRILIATGAAIEAAVWYAVYSRCAEVEHLSFRTRIIPELLIRSHRIYRFECHNHRLNLQQTYFIARDLVTQLLNTRYCPSCRVHYFYHLQAGLVTCPFCTKKTPAS